MSSRLFALVVIVSFASALLIGHARAQTVYTPDSLASVMLTSDDVNLAFAPDQHVTDVADGSPTSDTVIRTVRIFKTDLGIVAETLFANADGSAPTDDERNTMLSGQYLSGLADTVFSNVQNFTVAGSTGAADADSLALFNGDLSGATWDAIGDSFLKGNVFGAILYATPTQADGGTLGVMLAFQLAKLL